MDVLIKPQVLIAVKRLRMFFQKCVHILFRNTNFVIDNRRIKFMQGLGIVVFGNASVDSIVPVVNSAEKVVAFHVAVTHQGRAMVATAEQN